MLRATSGAGCALVVALLLVSALPIIDAARSAAPVRETDTTSSVAARQLAAAQASLNRTASRAASGLSSLHWLELDTSGIGPSGRDGVAMAYDPLLDGVVLFGGYFVQVAPAGDTWLFRDGAWSNVTPTSGPSPAPRWSASMAYDPRVGGLILFGGRNLTQFFNDTWEYTASGWTQLSTSGAPSPRITSMAYDASLGSIVLFGGGIGNLPAGSLSPWTYYSDTWEFGLSTWVNVTSLLWASPPAMATTLAYDPATDSEIALGGSQRAASCTSINPQTAQWEFNGTGWTNESSQALNGPGGAYGLLGEGLVFDTALDAMVSFGGLTRSTSGTCFSLDATWEYANETWTNLSAIVGTQPSGRQSIQMVDDLAGNYLLIFGGNIDGTYDYLSDTWALTTNATLPSIPSVYWVELNPDLPAPSGRSGVAMAFDPLLDAVVLFGGYFVQVAAAGDTWLFQNGNWTDVSNSSAVSPAARWSASMVYDPALGKIVMFGGRNLTQFFNDTWEYDAAGWSQVSTNGGPSPRITSMTFDASLNAIILFGGGIGNLPAGSLSPWTRFADTWEFTGAGWFDLTGNLRSSPPALSTNIVYDAADGYAMIVGGSSSPTGCEPLSVQWSFNGTAWTNQSQLAASGPGGPDGISGEGIEFDSALNAVVVFGGLVPTASGGCTGSNQTWMYSGNAWTNLTGLIGPGPEGRQQIELADVSNGGYVVLFGGNIDGTFLYVNDTWALSVNESIWIHAGSTSAPHSNPPPAQSLAPDALFAFLVGAWGWTVVGGGAVVVLALAVVAVSRRRAMERAPAHSDLEAPESPDAHRRPDPPLP